jgi:hypothetical protein
LRFAQQASLDDKDLTFHSHAANYFSWARLPKIEHQPISGLQLRPLQSLHNRVPALRSHLLTPILDFRLAVEKFGCLAITLLLCNSLFFFWARSPLF